MWVRVMSAVLATLESLMKAAIGSDRYSCWSWFSFSIEHPEKRKVATAKAWLYCTWILCLYLGT